MANQNVTGLPFVHVFSTPGGHYVFDVNTRTVIRVSYPLSKLLASLEHGTTLKQATHEPARIGLQHGEMKAASRAYASMADAGFMSSKRATSICHPAAAILPDLLESCMEQLVLQVTKDCNLRCTYCIYSGRFRTRTHSREYMTEEVALRAVDYFFQRSWNTERVTIGFYGGEPLLNYRLIKQIISYVESHYAEKRTVFSMTTNLTKLSEAVARYVIDHEVRLHVSLDGPRSVNDKNRRFPSGKGTFDVVMQNLTNLRHMNEKYFAKCVTIGAVLDPETSFCDLSGFFMSESVVQGSPILADFESKEYAIHERQVDQRKQARYYSHLGKEAMAYFLYRAGRLTARDVSAITRDVELRTDSRISARMRTARREIPDRYHPGGPCVPGLRKLFVSTEGRFFPCEKVSESSNVACIGCLENGIDIEKVRNLLSIGEITSERCKQCWAADFCYLCVVFADGLTKLDAERKLSHCDAVVLNAEAMLKRFCVYKEFGIRLHL